MWNWVNIFLAAVQTLSSVAPEVAQQHWNGTGSNGKLANAAQIVRDAIFGAGSFLENLQSSSAAHPDNVHPEIKAVHDELNGPTPPVEAK